jgi:putative spermidine/putrescine transport system substrate-binding protein
LADPGRSALRRQPSGTGPGSNPAPLGCIEREHREKIMTMSSRRLSRRALIGAGIAAPLAPGLIGRAAAADPHEVVLVNWGGEAVKAMTDAFGTPFEHDTGIKVAIDTSGPTAGKIRAMVQSGAVTWDVCDATPAASIELGRAGLLEEIDYGVVDRNKTLPQFVWRWGVGSYMYSTVLAYDSARFPDHAPQSWADFWNLKDFPGKRLMRRDVTSMLEPALLADGVPIDKIYPIDVKRAFDKIRQIKENCLFWGSAAESAQLLRSGEVAMGAIWNTRATAVNRDTNGQVKWIWNGAVLQAASWVVPKGNPAGKTVMKFIASMQEPAREIALLRGLGSGPANPAAAKEVPADLQSINPTAPDRIAIQVSADAEWYADNYSKVLQDYLALISS